MRFGAGHSTAADARRAAADAASRAAETLDGQEPTLAVLITSSHHVDAAEDVLAAVHETVHPQALVGCVAGGVVAGRQEIETGPSVAVWLASLPAAAEAFQMEFVRTPTGGLFAGHRFDEGADDLHLLLADAASFPADLLLEHLNTNRPGTTVMGGLVVPAPLFSDREVLRSGAVGVRLPGWRGARVVSQGCLPVGEPYVVTGADGPVITELGGRPPLDRFREIVSALPPEQQLIAVHGPQVGILVDEYLEAPGRGDYLIRPIVGVDNESGAIQVGDLVDVGTTVRFQIRDAASADEDLRSALHKAVAGLAGRPAGALLFTCNGRGRRMFDVPDHDAALVQDVLGGVPLAGFFAGGELGPIGGRNALHGFTASLALFADE